MLTGTANNLVHSVGFFQVPYISTTENFRAVVSAFLSLSVRSTQFCFLLFLLYCICVDKINIHSFNFVAPLQQLAIWPMTLLQMPFIALIVVSVNAPASTFFSATAVYPINCFTTILMCETMS